MKTILRLTVFFALSISLVSCFSDSSEEKSGSSESARSSEQASESNESSDNPFAAMRQAVNEIEKAAGKAENKDGEKVETLHFKDIQEIMEDKVAGYKRTSREGQTNKIMGLKISNASADYEDGDKKIDLEISDTGGAGLALMSLAAWSNMEMEKETDDGFERTGEWQGYRIFEEYSKSRNRSSMSVIIADRIIVNAEGRGMEIDELKRFLKKMDLEKLTK